MTHEEAVVRAEKAKAKMPIVKDRQGRDWVEVDGRWWNWSKLKGTVVSFIEQI